MSQRNFTDLYERIDWSQARYRDCAFIALDVVPAPPGGTTRHPPADERVGWVRSGAPG